MVEGLLRHRFAARQDVTVVSAGVEALIAHPADPFAVEIMRQRGVDISTHRARQLSESILCAHSLVLTMERAQVQWILSRMPIARGRVFLLGHWRGGKEVTDPYGCERQAFEDVMGQLELYVDDWLERIAIAVK
jgi:protein-tyrosine phosphatase